MPIPVVIPIIATAASLLLQLYGASKAAKSQKLQDELMNQQIIDMQAKRERQSRIRNFMSVGSERIARMDFGDNDIQQINTGNLEGPKLLQSFHDKFTNKNN